MRECRYAQGQLIEVNAHSLFSKWFSESGKLVSRLFAKIQVLPDMLDLHMLLRGRVTRFLLCC